MNGIRILIRKANLGENAQALEILPAIAWIDGGGFVFDQQVLPAVPGYSPRVRLFVDGDPSARIEVETTDAREIGVEAVDDTERSSTGQVVQATQVVGGGRPFYTLS